MAFSSLCCMSRPAVADDQTSAIYDIRERLFSKEQQQKELESSKKLSLVLGLDNTLLHSVDFPNKLDSKIRRLGRRCCRISSGDDGRQKPAVELELHRVITGRKMGIFKQGCWTKLRPGVSEFLSKASELYELHVCTLASRIYADEMVKLLDPTGELFKGRVMCREDFFKCKQVPLKKSLVKVTGLDWNVVVVDRAPQVWNDQITSSRNFVKVDKYAYFHPPTRHSKVSFLESETDENEEVLARVLLRLRKIHSEYFSNTITNTKIQFSNTITNTKIQPLHEQERRLVIKKINSEYFSNTITNTKIQPQHEQERRLVIKREESSYNSKDVIVQGTLALPLWKTIINFILAMFSFVISAMDRSIYVPPPPPS